MRSSLEQTHKQYRRDELCKQKKVHSKRTLTRLGGLNSSVPVCPNVITLRVEAIGLKESRRWTGMDAYGEAG